MKRRKTDVFYALLTNGAHIGVCFLCYLLRVFDLYEKKSFQAGVFILDALIWILCGLVCSLGKNDNKQQNGLLFAFYTLIPITLITSLSAILGSRADAVLSWSSFFFIGAIVNFWNRPFILISGLIKNDAYLFFFTILIVLFAVISFMYYNGVRLNKAKRRRGKRRRVSAADRVQTNKQEKIS